MVIFHENIPWFTFGIHPGASRIEIHMGYLQKNAETYVKPGWYHWWYFTQIFNVPAFFRIFLLGCYDVMVIGYGMFIGYGMLIFWLITNLRLILTNYRLFMGFITNLRLVFGVCIQSLGTKLTIGKYPRDFTDHFPPWGLPWGISTEFWWVLPFLEEPIRFLNNGTVSWAFMMV